MIAIRAAVPADAEAIAAIYGPHVLAGVATFEEARPDGREMARRMAGAGGSHPWLVATGGEAGDVFAFACAAPFHARAAYRWTVETTVYVSDAMQRRGAGRLLTHALVHTLAAQGFAQAIARIALPNDASVALHETMGFAQTGVHHGVGCKHGRWIDVGLWQRGLAVAGPSPAEPKPFAEVGVVRA